MGRKLAQGNAASHVCGYGLCIVAVVMVLMIATAIAGTVLLVMLVDMVVLMFVVMMVAAAAALVVIHRMLGIALLNIFHDYASSPSIVAISVSDIPC